MIGFSSVVLKQHRMYLPRTITCKKLISEEIIGRIDFNYVPKNKKHVSL